MLGRAAAPNLIVGRCDPLTAEVFFDSGDELLIEDSRGNPIDIMATDHTGTFMDWQHSLDELAAAYADPVLKRATFLNDPKAFGEAFLAAFTERFARIQRDYLKRRRAFETLFKYARRDADSDLAVRWKAVLDRLETARPGGAGRGDEEANGDVAAASSAQNSCLFLTTRGYRRLRRLRSVKFRGQFAGRRVQLICDAASGDTCASKRIISSHNFVSGRCIFTPWLTW